MTDKPLIMVVDDDEDGRTMVRTILESRDFDVVDCASGKEALEALENDPLPKLVLLDIMMPEMNGYDTLISLKQKPRTQELPVIFLTAKGDPEDLMVGYNNYGVEYYITKPFTTSQLLAGIRLVLDVA